MIDPLSKHIHRHAGLHGPVMLMYHAVAPGRTQPDWPWAVSMKRFIAQLDFLAAEGYSTPTLQELIASPSQWSGRTAVITFDDGYIDNLAACEELQQKGMRASWFIVSGSIGRQPSWPADGRPGGRLLNTKEIRDMHSAGMEIGSHSVTHVRLTQTDDVQLAQELVDSKAILEDILGNPVSSFAYPYGDWDERCAAAAKQAGYTAACTTRTGWALRDNDPYRLRRITVTNTDTASRLARKLRYASNDVAWKSLLKHYLQQAQSRLKSHQP